MLNNVKMPTIVGVLTFISMINTSQSLRQEIFQHLNSYEQLKFQAKVI